MDAVSERYTLDTSFIKPPLIPIEWKEMRGMTMGFVVNMKYQEVVKKMDPATNDTISQNVLTNAGIMEEIALDVPSGIIAGDDPVETKPMDTITLITYPVIRCSWITGMVQTEKTEIRSLHDSLPFITRQPNNLKSMQEPRIFPNPIPAGALLTVSIPENSVLPERVELISASGQVILSLRQAPTEEASVFNLRLPPGIPAGGYFLRLTHTSNGTVSTHKIIVQ